jgi:hypothetical protein
MAMRRWLEPLRVELDVWGREFGDVAFGPSDEFLVSERFNRLWHEEDLVGLAGFDLVEITAVRRRRGRGNRAAPAYFRVSVARSEVAVDQEQSGVVWENHPDVSPAGQDLNVRRTSRPLSVPSRTSSSIASKPARAASHLAWRLAATGSAPFQNRPAI